MSTLFNGILNKKADDKNFQNNSKTPLLGHPLLFFGIHDKIIFFLAFYLHPKVNVMQ